MDWGILSNKKEKQEEFLFYLKEWNKVHNLTGIKDFSLWWSHHIQDSLSTLEYLNNELWAGGENIILYYDQKKDYWRTITESRGIPNGIIWDLCIEDGYIWIGSSGGLSRFELATKYGA